LSELVRPILSKVTNGRDIHTKLVRYIVKQWWNALYLLKLLARLLNADDPCT